MKNIVLFILCLFLSGCATSILNVEQQKDGSYWIVASGNSAESARKAAEKKASEAALKSGATYKIIKSKASDKIHVEPSHTETRWEDRWITGVDGQGQLRQLRTTIPVTLWVPERKWTTYYSEIWAKFDRPVILNK